MVQTHIDSVYDFGRKPELGRPSHLFEEGDEILLKPYSTLVESAPGYVFPLTPFMGKKHTVTFVNNGYDRSTDSPDRPNGTVAYQIDGTSWNFSEYLVESVLFLPVDNSLDKSLFTL